MDDRTGWSRQAGLLVVVFVATLALLVGTRALIEAAGSGARVASASPSGVRSIAPGSSAGAAGSGGPAAASFGPDPSGTVVLTGAGDIAKCGSDGARQTSDLLLGQPGALFTAGDNAYEDGSAQQFAACYDPTWGRVKDRTILPAVGNHDWGTPGAAGYLGYFGTVASPAGVTWYSRDLGAWHVVVLDSNCEQVGGCGLDSAQGRWLAADLAASSTRCTLAIWHHPRFSSGEHGNDDDVGVFWDLLHNDGADLVVNAHDHDYERFAPQDPSAREERPGGIREIVVGTGGAELRSFRRTAPNSELRLAGVHGVLRLTLHPANYDWEFLPVSGAAGDAGSTICR